MTRRDPQALLAVQRSANRRGLCEVPKAEAFGTPLVYRKKEIIGIRVEVAPQALLAVQHLSLF